MTKRKLPKKDVDVVSDYLVMLALKLRGRAVVPVPLTRDRVNFLYETIVTDSWVPTDVSWLLEIINLNMNRMKLDEGHRAKYEALRKAWGI